MILLVFILVSCNDATNDKTPESNSGSKQEVDQNTTKHENETVDGSISANDYDVFDNPYLTENSEQVVVYEFFGYSCPHCYSFQPYMEKWLENKPDYVKLVRVPLNFQPGWGNLQQAYLTAEIMGIVEQSHKKLFDSIHKDHKRFNSIDDLAQWYADEMDVNKDEFLSTADSFILDSKQRKADKMGFKMQVTSTPTVIVNGKLRPSKDVHDREKIMEVLDFLVKKEEKEMGLIK
jgi:thiol:disulfide interchange protein DsbA